jgi:hypothetical protein
MSADTRALLVLLFLGGIIPPRAKKIFRLAALAIFIPLTSEPESAPLIVTHYFSTFLQINLIVFSLFSTLLLVLSQILQNFITYNSCSEISALA